MNSHEELAPLLAAYELKLLSPEDRARFEGHLIECDNCFEDAYSYSTVAEYFVEMRKRQPAVRRTKLLRIAPLAVAACLVIFAAAGYWIFKETSGVQEMTTRGAKSIEILMPQENQLLSPPVLFQWRGNSSASYYLLRIWSGAGAQVISMRLEANSFRWVPSSTYSAGRYTWSVDACLSDGTIIAGSQPVAFTLK